MAIYSLHHAPIGKATQPRRYTAAAHLRYITRASACTRMMSARMPAQSVRARAWLRKEEDQDRKNARVGDKVLLALPRELGALQRAELIRRYAEDVTRGKASWMSAFHERGDDLHNPHVHLFIRDRDPETGKRACGMSERGSTERLRELWERHANRALAGAGRPERIDRRTLAAQGIRRQPTIHEGLSARDMQSRGRRIRSKPVNYRNGPGARSPGRVVDYRQFDRGRSRPAYNRAIKETPSDYWAAIDTDHIIRGWQREDAERERFAREGAIARKKEEPGFLQRVGKGAERVGKKIDDFHHDPSKPVKRGRDAPVMFMTRTGSGRDQHSLAPTQRRMSPREQQEMSTPEAVYKKVIRPGAEKVGQWIKPSEPSKEAERPRSFSDKLAKDRAAPKAEKDPKDKDLQRERWKKERQKGRER